MILDHKLLLVEAHLDIPNTIRSYFPEWREGENVRCPWHDDANASLHIHGSGKAYCHGCKASFANIAELVGRMEGVGYFTMRDRLYAQCVNAVPPSRYQSFRKALLKSVRARGWLEQVRHISETTQTEYMLGLDPGTNRIAVPIFDCYGACVNIRLVAWQDRRNTKYKVINTRGHGETRLYPEWKVRHEDKLLLVEGEFDTIVGRQADAPACTWTGGAGSWNDRYNWLFGGKSVFILYDNDEAGKAGAQAAMERLRPIVRHVEMIAPLMEEGKDLSDWFGANLNQVFALADMINEFKPGKGSIVRKKLCPTCGQEMPR